MTQALGRELRAVRRDRAAWTQSRPPAAELEAIGRFLACGREAGRTARLHVVHVSTADGLAKIAAARANGTTITAETCPHYLWFSVADFERIEPTLKCAPPVRDPTNRKQL